MGRLLFLNAMSLDKGAAKAALREKQGGMTLVGMRPSSADIVNQRLTSPCLAILDPQGGNALLGASSKQSGDQRRKTKT
jgi:hypothetical protein